MFVRLIILIGLAVASLGLANAQNPVANADTDYTHTEIFSEADAFAPGDTLWLAIRQEVRPGWHVFWKNPGDAGLPLALQWDFGNEQEFVAGGVLFPAPQYIPVGPLASYAHEGSPVFLVPVTAPETAQPGEEINISLNASWQVCEEICVPEDAQFSFSLPVAKESTPSDAASVFAQARAMLPQQFDGAAAFKRVGSSFELEIEGWEWAPPRNAFFFPAIEGLTQPAGKQKPSLIDSALKLSMAPGWNTDISLTELEGVLTFKMADGARKAVALTAVIEGSLAADTPQLKNGDSNIAVLLALAFFGGIILNIMPCVFPILFVKAASMMQAAKKDPVTIRKHGLFYTGGVLAMFIFMGSILLALRAGGEQLGWGFHLQSPLVVGLSAYVLFLVGLNLAGLFSVGESITGAGDTLTKQNGASGAFFTGVLAVVVAAPCIGPLLTAPMGAALTLSPAAGMAIFVAMALGLAAPYLALAYAPGLGRRLPKPGPWMAVFKQALAFPVFAAAAYFLWVFSRQAGEGALAIILMGAILLAFSAWLFELSKGDDVKAIVIRVVSALAALLAIAPLTRIEARSASISTAPGAYGSIATEAYDAEALANYRAAGTPVFIDFTADWCVTCQFNKMTVLKSAETAEVFQSAGAVLMVADWTVRDPKITEALASYGASGVPLYVVYPATGSAKILPPTLTKKNIREAFSGL